MTTAATSTALVKLPEAQLVQINDLLAKTPEMVVDSEETFKIATDVRAVIKALQATLEQQRDALVRPKNLEVKAINTTFKGWSVPLENTDRALEGKMVAWRAAERRRIDEEQRRIAEENDRRREEAGREEARRIEAEAEATRQAALELGLTDAEANQAADDAANAVAPVIPVLEVAPVQQTTVRGSIGTSVERQDWKFEVVDPSLVPDEFWVIDEAEIGRAVRAGLRDISGVRIYAVDRLSRR